MSEEEIEKIGISLYKFLKEKTKGMERNQVRRLISIVYILFLDTSVNGN